ALHAVPLVETPNNHNHKVSTALTTVDRAFRSTVVSRGRRSILFRIQLDDETLVDVLTEFRAVGRALERAGHLLRIDLDPRREADLFGELQRILDAELRLRALRRRYDVARPEQRRRHVQHLAVDGDRAMRHELARFGARRSQSHPVDDVVETRFEELQQVRARRALALRRLGEIAPELPLEHTVDPAQLLLFAELMAVVRRARAGPHAMLARLGVELALRVERSPRAFQEEVGAFPSRQLAFR